MNKTIIIILFTMIIGIMTVSADIVKGRVVDAETGYEQYIDTSSKSLRQAHERYWHNRQQQLRDTMTRSNVDLVSIATNEDYVKALLMLFKQRS